MSGTDLYAGDFSLTQLGNPGLFDDSGRPIDNASAGIINPNGDIFFFGDVRLGPINREAVGFLRESSGVTRQVNPDTGFGLGSFLASDDRIETTSMVIRHGTFLNSRKVGFQTAVLGTGRPPGRRGGTPIDPLVVLGDINGADATVVLRYSEPPSQLGITGPLDAATAVFNSQGDTAFRALFEDAGGADQRGVFRQLVGGPLTAVALGGQQIPGNPANTHFTNTFRNERITQSAETYFIGGVDGTQGAFSPAHDVLVSADRSGVLTNHLQQDDVIEDTRFRNFSEFTHGSINSFSVNSSGRLAINTGFSGRDTRDILFPPSPAVEGVIATTGNGIFIRDGADQPTRILAVTGQLVPGINSPNAMFADDSSFGDSVFSAPIVGGGGDVAFSAFYKDPLTQESVTTGVFLGSNRGDLRPILTTGASDIKGLDEGFKIERFDSNSLLLNAAGQIAFVAFIINENEMTPGTNDPVREKALFATDENGEIEQIVRTGEIREYHFLGDALAQGVVADFGLLGNSGVNSLSSMIATGAEEGLPTAFSDDGQLLFNIGFSSVNDASRQIDRQRLFVASVPEPTSLALIISMCGLTMNRRRRRSS